MADLCIEALQHMFPFDSYVVYLEKWLLFQIKTLASHGSLPFQDFRKLMKFYKLSAPLMLGLTDKEDPNAQDREWENAEKNDGFYPLGETPALLPQEIRGDVRSLKEMQED